MLRTLLLTAALAATPVLQVPAQQDEDPFATFLGRSPWLPANQELLAIMLEGFNCFQDSEKPGKALCVNLPGIPPYGDAQSGISAGQDETGATITFTPASYRLEVRKLSDTKPYNVSHPVEILPAEKWTDKEGGLNLKVESYLQGDHYQIHFRLYNFGFVT